MASRSCLLASTLAAALFLPGYPSDSGSVWAQQGDPDAGAEEVPDEPRYPVSVSVKLGYAEKMPTLGFIPVFVELASRDVDRLVEVSVLTKEGRRLLMTLGQVKLEAGQPRRLRHLAPAKALSEAGALVVSCVDDSEQVVGEVSAYPDPSSAPLLLVIDRRGAAPADFSSFKTFLTTRKGHRRPEGWSVTVVSRLEDLPQSALGYTGVSAVLLGDLELERWSDAQAQALAGWLARGGNLVVTIGTRGSLLRQSLLGRRLGEALAPIPFDQGPVAGTHVTLEGVLGSFGPLDGITSTSPPYLAKLHPGQEDAILYRDDAQPQGRPIVVERRHGAGKVTLVAPDLWAPPFLHAAHSTRMVEALLLERVESEPRSNYLFQELAAVRQPAQIGPAFAVLIIYALIAGPGVYFLLRAKKKGILLWLVIPALTVGFTLLVPFYRLILKDAESTLVGVRLIEARTGDPLAVETIDALVFSGSLDDKKLTLRGEDAAAFAVIPPRRFRRGNPNLGPVLGTASSEGVEFDLRVALWGARYVSFERTWAAPKITGSVELSMGVDGRGGVADLALEYEGGFPLENAVVLFPDLIAPLIVSLDDPLRPGGRFARKSVSAKPAVGYETDEKNLGALMVERLIQRPYRKVVESQRRAFLIGYTQEAPPLRARPNVRTRAFATVVVVELRVFYRDGVPFGMARSSQEAATIAMVNTSTITRALRTRLSLPGGRQQREARKMTVRLRVPRGVVLRPEALRLEGQYQSEGGAIQWRPVPVDPDHARLDDSGREVEVRIDDPTPWISKDGDVVLRQVFDRPRLDSDRQYAAQIDVSVEWEEP